MRTVAAGLVALSVALSACATRSPGGAARPERPRWAATSGFAPGLRLRTDTPSLSEMEAASRAPVGFVPGASYPDESSYGPAGTPGSPYVPCDGWGTVGPCGGYGTVYGPAGVVPPDLRPPSDAPVLHPASPYRGPADPPDVFERPGTVAGNDTYRHP